MSHRIGSIVLAAAFAAGAVVAPRVARADDPAAAKLGEAYAKAGPADKLAHISVAQTDKTLDYKEVGAACDHVVTAEVAKGKTSEERLRILGKLRADAQTTLKKINEERKAAKKQSSGFHEPDSHLQLALSIAYLADSAGARPALGALGGLKVVRDCTAWTAHHKLVLASLQEALARDEGFAKADSLGKLDIVKQLADRELMSDQERTYIENAILTEWMAAELKAGKSAGELAQTVRQLHKEKRVCFFSQSWAEGMLKRLEGLK